MKNRRFVLVAVLALLTTACGLSTAAPPTIKTVPQIASHSVMPAHRKVANRSKPATAIVKIVGGGVYTVSVPEAWLQHSPPISLVDVPQGVVFSMPTRSSPELWNLWLRPYDSYGGPLFQNARLLVEWPFPVRALEIQDATGAFALVQVVPTTGEKSLWAINLDTGSRLLLFRFSSQTPDMVDGRGVAAWAAGPNTVRVMNLTTGAVVEKSGVSTQLEWQNGTVIAGGNPFALPFLQPYRHPLPTGFRWLTMNGHPLVAAPNTWKISSILGGSSLGVKAVNPHDPAQQVTVVINGCVGCFSPLLSGGLGWWAPDSPLLNVQPGESAVWIGDHAVAYTVRPGPERPYSTYGLTIIPPSQGNIEVMVNVPRAQKALATTILNTTWYP